MSSNRSDRRKTDTKSQKNISNDPAKQAPAAHATDDTPTSHGCAADSRLQESSTSAQDPAKAPPIGGDGSSFGPEKSNAGNGPGTGARGAKVRQVLDDSFLDQQPHASPSDAQAEAPSPSDPIESDRSIAWIDATRKRRKVIEAFCMSYVHRAEFIPRYGEVAARTWPISRSEFAQPDIIPPEQRRDLVEWIHLVAHFTTQLHHLGKLGRAGLILAEQLRDEPHRASEIEQEEAIAMEAYEALESSFFSLIASTRYPRN